MIMEEVPMPSFNIIRKGYDPQQVDLYVREVEEKIAALEAELADFRGKADAINSSVIEAKLLAERLEAEAGDRIRAAEEKAAQEITRRRKDASDQMEGLRQTAAQMRGKLDAFKEDYNQLLNKYLVSVRAEDMTKLFDDLDTFMNSIHADADAADAAEAVDAVDAVADTADAAPAEAEAPAFEAPETPEVAKAPAEAPKEGESEAGDLGSSLAQFISKALDQAENEVGHTADQVKSLFEKH